MAGSRPAIRLSEDDLVTWLLRLFPLAAQDLPRRNHCILATRVAVEVGEYFGHRVTPMAVNVAAMNSEAFELWKQGVTHEEWPETAWSAGAVSKNTMNEEENSWDGHLCAWTRTGILDLNANQLDRPARGIHVKPFYVKRPSGGPPWVMSLRDGQTMVVIEPRPEIKVWKRSADWRLNHREFAAKIIRTITTTMKDAALTEMSR